MMAPRFAIDGLLFLINFVHSKNLPDSQLITTSSLSTPAAGTTPTTFAPGCPGSFTVPPDVVSHCGMISGTDPNRFTLPNGHSVSEDWKFCACALERFDMFLKNCREGEFSLPDDICNADGTFKCRRKLQDISVCVNSHGEKPNYLAIQSGQIHNPFPNCNQGAYCQSACIRYSKELQRFQNVGECNCTLAHSQETDSGLPPSDSYVPQCNADGSWQRQQTGYGGSWCVDVSGNPTGDISFGSLYAAAC